MSIDVKQPVNQLYPLFFKANQLRILIIGGGEVALEKLSNLLLHSPNAIVRIVGTTISDEIKNLISGNENVELIERPFTESDLNGIRLVISALNDIQMSEEIGAIVRSKGILYNAADKPELCDFYLGSVVSKGNLKIGISTNGKSPTMAKRIKEAFNEMIPDEIDESIENMHEIRKYIKGNWKI
jgi:siroheme synthase-like protein